MNDKKLKLIDFSNGIKQTEIQENFDIIQSEIDKERRAVGGPGISYGFDFKLDGFKLSISEGCLIANDGSEVYVDNMTLEIDKPILIEKKQLLSTVDEFNRLKLPDKPYANTRMTTSDNVDLKVAGVKVVQSVDNNIELSIANINDYYLTLNSLEGLTNMKLDVFYNATYKRRDVIFIDRNYKLQYRQGITSPSPSVPEVKETEYMYMLGYLEIDGFGVDALGKEIATIKFIKDFKSVRNVYTSSDNKLYLCGQAFDSIKTIHTVEPTNPEEFALWYDSFSNELKVWRHTDTAEFVDAITFTSTNPNHPQNFDTNVKYKYGQSQIKVYLNGKELEKDKEFEEGSDLTELQKEDALIWSKQFHIISKLGRGDIVTYRITRYDGYAEWVAANTKSYTMAQERFIFSPNYLSYMTFTANHDLQHFFFDSKNNRNMLYTPGKNCLEILIDQVPLHSDQYDEITINDAIAGDEASYIRKQLVTNYGYKNDFEEYKLAEDYDNIGVGFKLGAALQKKSSYIEAIVTHRVNSNPISKRFQRSATFVAEDSVIYHKYIETDAGAKFQEPIFTTSVPFRYQENQLEVYKNGTRLDKGVDFIELAADTDDKGSNLFSFKIISAINDKDRISYKISSTIYSYDNVEALISGFKSQVDDMKIIVKEARTEVEDMKKQIADYSADVREHIEELSNIESNLDSRYLLKTAQIGKDNLQSALYTGIAVGLINSVISITEKYQKIDVTDKCYITDFVILTNINSNKILCRETDYKLTQEGNKTFMSILTSDVIASNNLYLSGIRFNR